MYVGRAMTNVQQKKYRALQFSQRVEFGRKDGKLCSESQTSSARKTVLESESVDDEFSCCCKPSIFVKQAASEGNSRMKIFLKMVMRA